MLVPLLEWNPDTDETRPGIMTDVEHMIPKPTENKVIGQGND